jgi:aminopeptidase-like protein
LKHNAENYLMNTDYVDRMYDLLVRLWPMHRTLNSDDLVQALDMCGKYLNHNDWKIHSYPVGSDVYTWYIPQRYKVKEAWLEINGDRVADFYENPLHLLSYSTGKQIEGTLGAIRDHIWTSPDHPHAIPWEFKYYERSWGFCLRQADLDKYDDNAVVRGVIDVEFTDDPFTLGEIYLPGETDQDILFLTNICHPAQVNDSITGLVVGLEMARQLARIENRQYGFRLLVVPETVGTIAWFANNEAIAKRIKYAWFCEMVGHDNSFILQHSRQGDSLIDKAFQTVLPHHRKLGVERTGLFREVVASDEMVTNGPGWDIPTPSLTRWPYDQYHTSDDNPDIVIPENLQETLDLMMDLWQALEEDYYPLRKFKGPVMLSRHGLWVDWRVDPDLNLATEKIMMMLEGNLSLIEIAHSLGLPLDTIRHFLGKLADAGLIEKLASPQTINTKGQE